MRQARHLFWLIPTWLLFQGLYQLRVLNGMSDTYATGEMLTAFVDDFDIKHISSQTNGYVVLRFQPAQGAPMTEKLALPVQVAARIQNLAAIPIRYNPASPVSVVMEPTYPFQQRVVVVNLAILAVSFTIMALVATYFSRRKPD